MAKKGYRFTQEDVLKAIKGSCGNVSTVMQKLKCKSWSTAEKYINKWTNTREAFESEKNIMNDYARNVIQKDILSGSVQSAKWWLERKCRDEFGCRFKPEEQPQQEAAADNKFEFIITDEALEEQPQQQEQTDAKD